MDGFLLAVFSLEKINVKEQEQTEAVVRWCSIKKLFLEISQNSQENICVRESF